jgi:hypothetical protein
MPVFRSRPTHSRCNCIMACRSVAGQ